MTRPHVRLLVGVISTLVGACSVGSAYRRPVIPLSPKWSETAVPAATTGGSSASVWPSAAWWHGFGSARLDELIAQAERSNDDIAGAIARVQEADAQVRVAGAPLLPTLDLSGAATRERASTNGASTNLFNLFNPELTASYELDFWGKNRAVRDAARAT